MGAGHDPVRIGCPVDRADEFVVLRVEGKKSECNAHSIDFELTSVKVSLKTHPVGTFE